MRLDFRLDIKTFMEVMLIIWLMSLKNEFGLINVLDFYIVGTFRGGSFLFKNHHYRSNHHVLCCYFDFFICRTFKKPQ